MSLRLYTRAGLALARSQPDCNCFSSTHHTRSWPISYKIQQASRSSRRQNEAIATNLLSTLRSVVSAAGLRSKLSTQRLGKVRKPCTPFTYLNPAQRKHKKKDVNSTHDWFSKATMAGITRPLTASNSIRTMRTCDLLLYRSGDVLLRND